MTQCSKILVLFLFVTLAVYGQASSTASGTSFVVFDGTLYQRKPDLRPFGLKPITICYSSSLWKKASDSQSLPTADTIRDLAIQASKSTGIVAIDIESWPVTGDPSIVAQSLQKYTQTINLFKQSAPSLKVGYYGVAPIRNYWDAIGDKSTPKYKAWQTADDRVSSIGKTADVLFPSVYTFYKDEIGWRTYATAQIAEARRISNGKPVYVFLWPQFHDASSEYLPPGYWRMELNTARQYADGIVIWGGWQQPWNPNAPWWLETLRFLNENHIGK